MKKTKYVKAMFHAVIILVLAFMAVRTQSKSMEQNQNVDRETNKKNESSLESVDKNEKDVKEGASEDRTITLIPTATSTPIPTATPIPFDPEKDIADLESYPEITYDRNWTDHEKECLAKLAMAEAEGQSLQVKTLIILTVLNRVQSPSFPDTIEEVILQKGQYFYTYSPGGRYHWVEPNEDCWRAVEIVQNVKYDFSDGAMYFENSSDNSWASRNLELTVKSGGTKFYK